MLKILARNILSNSASTFLKLAISFLLTPFLILHLGREKYGLWLLLMSFSVSGTLSLLSLGLQSALIKHVAEFHALRDSKALNQIISSTLYVYTFMGLIGCAALFLFSHFWLAHCFSFSPADLPVAKLLLGIMAVQVLFELPGLCFDAVLGGLQRFDILAVTEVSKAALLALLFFLALSLHGTIVSLSVITLAITVSYSLLLFVLSRRELPGWRLVRSFDRQQLLPVVSMTKDLFILRLNGIVYNNMDKMIIAAAISAAAVTEYDIGNKIHTMALMVMGLAGTVVIPATSAADARSESDRIRTLFLRGTKYALAMTLPVICILFVLAPEIVRVWISPQYVSSAFYARLFLSYLLFWTFTAVGWNMLIGVNLTKSIVKIQIASIAVNLFLSYILARSIGVSGVIYGTIIGNLVAFFPYMTLMMRTFKVSFKELFLEIVLCTYPQAILTSALLFALSFFWLPNSVISLAIQAILAAGFYCVLFFYTGMRREERVQILSLVSVRMAAATDNCAP
jgi:O-antigen/teichoic acid export membrane protein